MNKLQISCAALIVGAVFSTGSVFAEDTMPANASTGACFEPDKTDPMKASTTPMMKADNTAITTKADCDTAKGVWVEASTSTSTGGATQ